MATAAAGAYWDTLLEAVGTGVAELSAGFALALEMGARLEDVAGTVHAHPTRGEAVQEAALRALGAVSHGSAASMR